MVGAAGLAVGQLAPPLAGEVQDWSEFRDAASSGSVPSGAADEIPVDRSDRDWDPWLDELAQACAEGSFVDCDDLYWESEYGSDYEYYGSTCGGYSAVQQRGDCSLEFD